MDSVPAFPRKGRNSDRTCGLTARTGLQTNTGESESYITLEKEKVAYFRAMPKLAGEKTLPPIQTTWSYFFGRQNNVLRVWQKNVRMTIIILVMIIMIVMMEIFYDDDKKIPQKKHKNIMTFD